MALIKGLPKQSQYTHKLCNKLWCPILIQLEKQSTIQSGGRGSSHRVLIAASFFKCCMYFKLFIMGNFQTYTGVT